jgi:alpha-L-fucosidase
MRIRFLAPCLALVALVALDLVRASADHVAKPADPPINQAAETPEQRDARMRWWRDARFGIFIHWGLYSIPAGTWDGKQYGGASEWLINSARIDPMHWERELIPRFNPVKFNPEAWAQLFKQSGAGYVVLTSKHHDGFCLWPTGLNDYNAMTAPAKRDLVGDLTRAVSGQGLHMGLYHSFMDWHHPDYLPRREWDHRPPTQASLEPFVGYVHAQLRDLLTRYPQVDLLWFDGEWESTWTPDLGHRTERLVRTLKPGLIVNNRVGPGRDGMAGFTKGDTFGDYGTPEQEVPVQGPPGVDWESCMTMNGSWGFHAGDHNWKSARQLIRTLCDTASKGGNFLLNVGPTAEGEIPPECVERLQTVGRWMHVNGSAIRGTQASPFTEAPAWGRITMREVDDANGKPITELNLMVFEWPVDGRLALPRGVGTIDSAFILADGAALPVEDRDGSSVLRLPPCAPDTVVSVVRVLVSTPVTP